MYPKIQGAAHILVFMHFVRHRAGKGNFDEMRKAFPKLSLYRTWLYITQMDHYDHLDESQIDKIKTYKEDIEKVKKYQHKETIYRYQQINNILKKTYHVDKN